MERKKQKKQIRLKDVLIILIIIVLILLLTAVLSVFKENYNNDESENIVYTDVNVVINDEEIAKSSEEDELNKIKQMGERNRIEYYISNFIRDVEEKDYKKAYSVLNKDFKRYYFPTIDDFIKYAENKFTVMLDIEYTNFERNGQIYVSWLTMTDAINGGKDSGEEMNFVVKENDFNDFELSFSIK